MTQKAPVIDAGIRALQRKIYRPRIRAQVDKTDSCLPAGWLLYGIGQTKVLRVCAGISQKQRIILVLINVDGIRKYLAHGNGIIKIRSAGTCVSPEITGKIT